MIPNFPHGGAEGSKIIDTQLAHDVVTTLGFGYFLVAMSDNVLTTLCFRRRYYDQKITLLQRCVFDVGFPTGINVATTS